MSKFSMGDRYDWRGEKHGPWRRGTGGLARVHFQRLPVRDQYRAETPRDAVMALVLLLTKDAVALYLWTEAV